jgi:adenylate cyclase
VWAAHFDRVLTDLFAVQDDVTSGIVGALYPQLLSAEAQSYRRQPPNSLDAWGLAVRGMMALATLTKENLDTAADFASRAVDIAPEFGLSYGLRAFALGYRAYTQWGSDWYQDAKRASADIDRTLNLQRDDPTALFLVGGASHFMPGTEPVWACSNAQSNSIPIWQWRTACSRSVGRASTARTMVGATLTPPCD